MTTWIEPELPADRTRAGEPRARTGRARRPHRGPAAGPGPRDRPRPRRLRRPGGVRARSARPPLPPLGRRPGARDDAAGHGRNAPGTANEPAAEGRHGRRRADPLPEGPLRRLAEREGPAAARRGLHPDGRRARRASPSRSPPGSTSSGPPRRCCAPPPSPRPPPRRPPRRACAARAAAPPRPSAGPSRGRRRRRRPALRRGPSGRRACASFPRPVPVLESSTCGNRAENRSDDGLRRVQASELPDHEEQAEHPGSHRVPEVLQVVRHHTGRTRRPASGPPVAWRVSRRVVAQLVEHRSPKPGVGGSSPSGPVVHDE